MPQNGNPAGGDAAIDARTDSPAAATTAAAAAAAAADAAATMASRVDADDGGGGAPATLPAGSLAARRAAAAVPGLRFGRAGGTATPCGAGRPAAAARSTFAKNFCAWLRICTAVLLPT